jgi:hypothetical protein
MKPFCKNFLLVPSAACAAAASYMCSIAALYSARCAAMAVAHATLMVSYFLQSYLQETLVHQLTVVLVNY